MLWIFYSLIYAFFTAIYTIFNQHYKLNAYLLGIWRGWGIAVIFFSFCFLFPFPKSVFYWSLLIAQGIMIAIYDSHLFFASAHYGAGPTSRIMALTAIVTTIFWWILTPTTFQTMVQNNTVIIIIIFLLIGFTISYWQMIKTPVSRKLANYMLPAILSLSGMSIATKQIALLGSSVYASLAYYLTVSTFISGTLNAYWYIKKEKPTFQYFWQQVFSSHKCHATFYVIAFSSVLIIGKTLALRIAANPGYVTAILLTAPLFVFGLNKYNKIPDNISVKAGFSMIAFLICLMVLVNVNSTIID